MRIEKERLTPGSPKRRFGDSCEKLQASSSDRAPSPKFSDYPKAVLASCLRSAEGLLAVKADFWEAQRKRTRSRDNRSCEST
jgi:hypothetical protein